MTDRILIVDYSAERLEHLALGLRARFKDIEVFQLQTMPPDPAAKTNFTKLGEIKANRYDILIGHIGGNPSGDECLKTFKEGNPKGKAVLYTKLDAIPLDKFEGLKLANSIFKRAEDSTRVFANDHQMLDVVNRIRNEPGLVHWTSPFKDKTVLASLAIAIMGCLGSLAGLAAALVKLWDGG
jgi:hypothetical protein